MVSRLKAVGETNSASGLALGRRTSCIIQVMPGSHRRRQPQPTLKKSSRKRQRMDFYWNIQNGAALPTCKVLPSAIHLGLLVSSNVKQYAVLSQVLCLKSFSRNKTPLSTQLNSVIYLCQAKTLRAYHWGNIRPC